MSMKKGDVKKNEKTFTNSLKGSRWWGLLLFLILVILDQVTKAVADVYFNPQAGVKMTLIPGMLVLGPMSYNRGFAFSSLAGSKDWLKFLLVMLTAVLMLILIIVYCKVDKRRTLFRIALIFIIAGGLANFMDRINYRVWESASYNNGFRDGVRDMLYVKIIFDFGCCNLADFFIVGGCVMLVLAMLFFDLHAIFPLGKYKKYSVEATQKANEKKKEQHEKKYQKYSDEANKK